MENKMNKFGVEKLLAVLAVAFACVCMWGCGDSDYRQWGGRYEGTLVAIIDDSLALLTNSRGYEDCHDVFMGSEECERKGTNDGLFLVNYRKQQSPYWGDTVDGEISLISGYYNDSSAFFSNTKNEFGFWKIGEKPRVVRKWNCETPCRCDRRKYGRPWIDGNVLLKMENQNECPYAVLDTATGAVKKLEFSGEYAWLEGCDDITYIDGKILCVKRMGDVMGSISILTLDGVVDSLENTKERDFLGYSPVLYGNFMVTQVYKKGKLVTKMKKGGFDANYPETWLRDNSFIDSTGSTISYYPSEDLIVTK